MKYAVYKNDTGQIMKICDCPDFMIAIQAGPDEGWLPCGKDVADDTHMVVGGEIVDRPGMQLQVSKLTATADGSDLVTMSGLPVPCDVRVMMETYRIEDGAADITFDLPGDYEIVVTGFPEKEARVTIHVTD